MYTLVYFSLPDQFEIGVSKTTRCSRFSLQQYLIISF